MEGFSLLAIRCVQKITDIFISSKKITFSTFFAPFEMQIRLDEYQRLATIAKVYGIEHAMLTPDETLKIAPVLNRDAFVGSLYSPGK